MKKAIKYLVVLAFLFVVAAGALACNKKTKSCTECGKEPGYFTVQFVSLCDIEIPPQIIKFGERATKPIPEREDYELDGWYTSKSFNEDEKWFFIGYAVTADMTLYAKWNVLPTEGLKYNYIGGAYEVVSFPLDDNYIENFRTAVIQSQYNGLPVTRIKAFAFNGHANLANVVIPESITEIGKNAFDGCTKLTVIDLPSSVTAIGDEAFLRSGITNISIPSSVKSIGADAFTECYNLESITLPDSIINIGKNAFRSCSLTIYIETAAPGEEWDTNWNLSNCPVISDCILSTDGTYVSYLFRPGNNIDNPKDYMIKAPYRKGYSFVGWGDSPRTAAADIALVKERICAANWERITE